MTIMHFVRPAQVELVPHEHKMWSTIGIHGGSESTTHSHSWRLKRRAFRRSGSVRIAWLPCAS